MNPISERISQIGVVPVIKLNHPERDAAPLAAALCEGGLPVAEVTFRAAGAAGTVVTGAVVDAHLQIANLCADIQLQGCIGFRAVFRQADVDLLLIAFGDQFQQLYRRYCRQRRFNFSVIRIEVLSQHPVGGFPLIQLIMFCFRQNSKLLAKRFLQGGKILPYTIGVGQGKCCMV